MKTTKIILGIDPGTKATGYGVLKVIDNRLELLTLGIIDLSKFTDHYVKLKKIFDRTLQLIETYSPNDFAIEAPFYGQNVQSMLKLGRAQGVAISAALFKDIPVFEYAPRKIKQAITGNGNASKEQVASLLEKFVSVKNLPKDLDATDGLAAAVCHYFQTKNVSNQINNTQANSWKEFIRNNPNKIK